MIHVFVGPTLEPGEGVLRAPLVRVHPPVQHGDLADESIAAGHTAVLIDGVYHQAPALRHKEMLAAVARGIRVIGAASIGALRAAELHGHGVIGVGRIYRAYVCGELTGDDEVAVGQAPDGDLRALTWPLVNLRHMVRAGERAGLLNADGAAALLRDFAAVHYPARTEGAVRAVCRRAGQTEFYRWVEEQRTADRHWGDVKRADALAALRLAHCPLTAAGPPAVWETGYSRAWSNELAGGEVGGQSLLTAARLAYQQLFDVQFPHVWTGWLEYLSQHGLDGPGTALEERLALLLDADTPPQGASPPACLVFRPVPDLRDETTVTLLLARETAEDRAALVRYAAASAAAVQAAPGFSPEGIDDDTARRTLQGLWRTGPDRLEEAAAARGFRNATEATERLKPFLPGLLCDLHTVTAAGIS